MKQLDPKKIREIRQLMWAAEQYLALASPLQAETERKQGDTAAAFAPTSVPDEETRRLVFLSAHMTSAAIRLATVDDALKRPGYADCNTYFNHKCLKRPLSFPDPAKWLHVMLRQNVGHQEPEGPSDRSRRQKERQACLERMTFATAYQMLAGIAAFLREHLQQEHSVTCL